MERREQAASGGISIPKKLGQKTLLDYKNFRPVHGPSITGLIAGREAVLLN
jgi:hypothetical protein